MESYERIYIQDFIISHLEQLAQGKIVHGDMPWYDMNQSVETCRNKGRLYMSTLHEMMLPYYEKYLLADPVICTSSGVNGCTFIENVAKLDPDFGGWASMQDIIVATEKWGDYLKRRQDNDPNGYFHLLRTLFFGGFQTNWEELTKELDDILFGTETNADYKTGELFCILHAAVKIMLTDWTIQKKQETFDLLHNQWGFLKNFYSVMIRRIVGSKLSNFAALTNNVIQTNDCHPHAHILYCALMDRKTSFNLSLKQFKSLDKAIERLRDILDKTKPSEILYELCDIIFPEEFQKILEEHRPKSYDEVSNENSQKDLLLKQMQEQTLQLNDRLKNITSLFEKMVESSISINEIEEELKLFPPGMAWDMLNNLNQNLCWSPVWTKYYPELRKKIITRLSEPIEQQKNLAEEIMMLAERPTHYYGSGSIYNDYSRQMTIEAKNKEEQQKLIGNE